MKTYSFARLLTGMLFMVLVAAMSLIAVVTSYFTRRSVRELSDRIVAQTLARAELRTDALLNQAMDQNAQAGLLMEGGQLSPRDFTALGGYFAHSLTVLHDLSDLGFGLQQTGDYVFAERTPDGNIRVREYVPDESGKRVIRDWRWSGAGRQLLRVAPWDGYDPRKRPFYQLAVSATGSAWTETYQFWQNNERGAIPGVTFATPLYAAPGKLDGVLDADFDLDALCRFLADLRKNIPGYAFVVEHRRDGAFRLIAHPDPVMLSAPGQTGNMSVMRDPVAAAFVQSAMADGVRNGMLPAGKSLNFSVNGREYFGCAKALDGPDDPPWTIAVVIPVGEVMADVYENDRRAFWLGLACLALTAGVAIRVARRIAQPLRQLTDDARAIGRLELDSKTNHNSRVEEVAHLASSMSDMKSSLRSFQKFVPVDVVREIVASSGEAKLGGQRAILTLFFSDIVNFTPMAEGMTPEGLVEHVGEYLGEMSEIIHANGGTVDKFIGDGIMAFWGAPSPHPDAAGAACRAALESQRTLEQMRARWQRDGKPEVRARIGLHTGSAIIGNIGSATRLNYTAIGDSVNIASRIEGLNKTYGTQILLSAACVEAAGGAIVSRPVENVSMKGRTECITAYELLGMAGETDEATLRVAELTRRAFAALARKDFPGAANLYREVLALWPADPVASFMEQRCCDNG